MRSIDVGQWWNEAYVIPDERLRLGSTMKPDITTTSTGMHFELKPGVTAD
jgi:hypothetical protein